MSEFSTTSIHDFDMDKMDLILTATTMHKDYIVKDYPHLFGKISTLREFAGYESDFDIIDPFGGDDEEYLESFTQILDCLEIIADIYI